LQIPLSVLEWRVDPDSGHHDPAIGDFGDPIILICAHGYSSSLAARRLQELGFANATDVIGGFEAWNDAGLPVNKLQADEP
jgi:rhodanese-related sulfurtransferase